MAGTSTSFVIRYLLAAIASLAVGACERESEGDAPDAPGRKAAPSDVALNLPDRPLIIGKTPPPAKEKKRDYQPFAAYLGEAIDHPMTMAVASSYLDAVDQIANGKADFSLLSPLSYVKAKARLPDLQPVVSIMREGQTKYRGYIIVRADSGIKTLADLKGKRFVFGATSSTSGYLLPTALMRAAGIDPARDFAAVEHVMDHRAILRRVQGGKADAGAVASTTFRLAAGEGVGGSIEIIAKSDWTPYDVFVAHPRVSPPAVSRIRAALLELNTRTTEGRHILNAMIMINGFVPVDDAAYDSLRRLQHLLDP